LKNVRTDNKIRPRLNSKEKRFVVINGDLIHAYLGCHIITVTEELISTASPMKEMSAESLSTVDSTHYINKVIL
jgi:hypothetical protein